MAICLQCDREANGGGLYCSTHDFLPPTIDRQSPESGGVEEGVRGRVEGGRGDRGGNGGSGGSGGGMSGMRGSGESRGERGEMR
jgi:hypothetical protein